MAGELLTSAYGEVGAECTHLIIAAATRAT
jgi:hypothetical protein